MKLTTAWLIVKIAVFWIPLNTVCEIELYVIGNALKLANIGAFSCKLEATKTNLSETHDYTFDAISF